MGLKAATRDLSSPPSFNERPSKEETRNETQPAQTILLKSNTYPTEITKPPAVVDTIFREVLVYTQISAAHYGPPVVDLVWLEAQEP